MDEEAGHPVAVLGTLAAVAGAITALIGVMTEPKALFIGALLLIGGLLLRIEAAIRDSNGTRSPRQL